MPYKVIRYFEDAQDNLHAYSVGDKYPRTGLHVSADRLEELSSSENLQGVPLIKAVKSHARRSVQGD